MRVKAARRVWREAARKRPGFIQNEHGTSLGSPPYPRVHRLRHRLRAGLGGLRRVHAGTLGLDLPRRRAAGIPAGLEFATKPQLAMGQLERLAAAGLPAAWAAFDEVYGRSEKLRKACARAGLAYVAIIPATVRSGCRRAR